MIFHVVVLEISLTTTLNILCICGLKNDFCVKFCFEKKPPKNPKAYAATVIFVWYFPGRYFEGPQALSYPLPFFTKCFFFFFFSLLFFFISQYVFHRGYSTRQLKLIHAKSLPLCEARLVPERNAKESSSQRCCREAPALAH